jgi:PTS system nitrogen regulatory IIA component|tara:strand:- start:4781 stop:5242 length:462 start_codon:yes stop_codon:yes gene_type:complete
MKLMDILVRDAVVLDLVSNDKRGVLDELSSALAEAEPSIDPEELGKILRERETLQSTGIGDGVAIPHGKLPGLPGLLASFARSREGVNFDSMDGEMTKLFFLLVVPEHSGGEHLKALARISRFFRDSTFRKSLLEADGLEKVLRTIEQEDEKF